MKIDHTRAPSYVVTDIGHCLQIVAELAESKER